VYLSNTNLRVDLNGHLNAPPPQQTSTHAHRADPRVRFPGTVELEFDYDPELTAMVRALRQRRWHPARKRWLVARAKLDAFLAELPRVGVAAVRLPVGVAAGHTASVGAIQPPPSFTAIQAPPNVAAVRPISGPSTKQRPAATPLSPERADQIAAAERELKLRKYSPRTCRAYLKLLRRMSSDLPAGVAGVGLILWPT
jgi:hypothetical protein